MASLQRLVKIDPRNIIYVFLVQGGLRRVGPNQAWPSGRTDRMDDPSEMLAGPLDETDLRAVTALLELAVLRQDLSDESRRHIRWLLNG